MINTAINSWDKENIAEAKRLQIELSGQVIARDSFPPLSWIAGVDVGFEEGGKVTRAAVALLRYSSLQCEEYAISRGPTLFPYLPGYLSFREVPEILKALSLLKQKPDIILCDGQGIAHPRRLGVASHLGVVAAIPTVGVAKSILVGTHDSLPETKGAAVPLWHQGEVIGMVLRSKNKVKPLIVSLGHCISLETSVSLVRSCLTKYRLPEPTRWAHYYASQMPR